MYKMLNLSLKELRLIAKNRNINGYEILPDDKLLRIIHNNHNGDGKSTFKSKKKETKNILYKPTKNNLFKLKREKIKKSLHKPSKKNIFKSKIVEIRKILHDSKINRNRKIEEIKKILYDPGNIFFKPEEDHYKPIKNGNAFSSNYIEYKSNGDKDKTLDEIKPYLSDIINDHKTESEWKNKLAIAIDFISSKDFEDTRTMNSKSDNMEILIGDKTDDSFLQ